MDEQCSLTSYENMGAALQRTTSCAMTFCKWPPSVRTTRKSSGCGALALPQCPACSRDAQAAFIWECSENHLDERGDSLAHEQTKPKHTVCHLSQFWASK